jgi:hypothetical protein
MTKGVRVATCSVGDHHRLGERVLLDGVGICNTDIPVGDLYRGSKNQGYTSLLASSSGFITLWETAGIGTYRTL